MLGLSFIGMAVWTLVSDKIEDEETQIAQWLGVFGATLVTFFFAEMGDKTQIMTVAMAAHYATPVLVVIGTTLGMLIADVPAVFVGDKLASRIPMKLVHAVAAVIFALLGIATLLGAGSNFGFLARHFRHAVEPTAVMATVESCGARNSNIPHDDDRSRDAAAAPYAC